ncbi:hypothetical protein N431DRAFT_427902 [Stipitochalara longipes BDJ]|nr:hypothetical protein N431DRAFT_427902 [Stipitochalara longipes BDJ]
MEEVLLLLEAAWQCYCGPANDLKARTDHKGAFGGVSEPPVSIESISFLLVNVKGAICTKPGISAGTKRQPSVDANIELLDKYTTKGANPEPAPSEKRPSALTKDHDLVRDTSYDALTPVVFGPNGSGYKGNDRSQKDHAATSAIYDYRGSYTRLERGRGGTPPGDDSDSDDKDDTPGGGRGPGRGGGDGPPEGESGSKMKRKEQVIPPRPASPLGEGFMMWGCCYCLGHAAMGIETTPACPGCSHFRCDYCPIEVVKVRESEIIRAKPRELATEGKEPTKQSRHRRHWRKVRWNKRGSRIRKLLTVSVRQTQAASEHQTQPAPVKEPEVTVVRQSRHTSPAVAQPEQTLAAPACQSQAQSSSWQIQGGETRLRLRNFHLAQGSSSKTTPSEEQAIELSDLDFGKLAISQ